MASEFLSSSGNLFPRPAFPDRGLSDRATFSDGSKMSKEPGLHSTAIDYTVARLVKETGINEQQARELVELLGLEWASLVREASIIAKGSWR